MSRAFMKDRDDAPEPAVRLARSPTGEVTPTWYEANRHRLEQEADPQERARLQDLLDSAVVVDPPADRKLAGFGATVGVVQGVGAQRTTSRYTIVGDVEADVRAGKIGASSPLARALLGARAGQRVVWRRPAGDVSLRVESVSYDQPMFVFFNNRLGCLGSLFVSALLTLVVVALMRGCNHA